MSRVVRLGAVIAAFTVVLITSCGSTVNPTAGATSTPSALGSIPPTPDATAPPQTTAAASATELIRLAALVYPACTASTCAGSAMFTTCDAGSAGADVFAMCPLTPRLATELRNDVAGVVSAPDPLGGGQDPEWTTEAFSAAPSSAGGVVHVDLGFGPGTPPEKFDLLVVVDGSQLLVDDVSCTGNAAGGADSLGPGWLTRSVCSS